MEARRGIFFCIDNIFNIIFLKFIFTNSIIDYNVIVTFLNKKMLSGVRRRYINISIRQYT